MSTVVVAAPEKPHCHCPRCTGKRLYDQVEQLEGIEAQSITKEVKEDAKRNAKQIYAQLEAQIQKRIVILDEFGSLPPPDILHLAANALLPNRSQRRATEREAATHQRRERIRERAWDLVTTMSQVQENRRIGK